MWCYRTDARYIKDWTALYTGQTGLNQYYWSAIRDHDKRLWSPVGFFFSLVNYNYYKHFPPKVMIFTEILKIHVKLITKQLIKDSDKLITKLLITESDRCCHSSLNSTKLTVTEWAVCHFNIIHLLRNVQDQESYLSSFSVLHSLLTRQKVKQVWSYFIVYCGV